MEDPWANAWGEASKPSLPHTSPPIATSSTWSAPSVSAIHGDHEDDLSMPSWPAEPTTRWNEPDLPETSLWGSDASAGWNPAPSTFDRISLTKDVVPEFNSPFDARPTAQEETDDDGTTSSASHSSPILKPEEITPPSPPPVEPLNPPPESPKPPPLVLPTVEDPDGFGTFETATDADESEGWDTPSKPNFSLPSADATAWGAAWGDTSSTSAVSERTDGVDDAWEAARQRKEKQDRHVPPELLASILLQLEELSNDQWRDTEAVSGGELENQRNSDFDSLGLSHAIRRLVPDDLTLPINQPFSKTFTSRQLSDALKFTRHAPLTRISPFAMFMISKGSTSWEAAIKARPNITQDDVTPVGWKIVETVQQDPTLDDGKKKTGGGLLSFFGRRATTSSVVPSRRSVSPGGASVKAGTSPRASVDSGRSNLAGRSTPASPVVASFASTTTLKSEQVATPSVSAASTVSVVSTVSVTSNALEEITRQPTPPPSAVSRFLGRFSSRQKTSSHESLSLSDNDLEFLSDVPTLQNDSDRGPDLDALSMMIKSRPLPATVPPPLPPPPSKPTVPFRPPVQPPKPPSSDDLFSIFDSPKPAATPPRILLPSATGVSVSAVRPPHTRSSSVSTPSLLPQPNTPTQPIISIEQPHRDNNDDWASFDYPSPPTAKTVAPQPKRTFVPILNSSRKSSTSPNPQPLSAFTLPPPPSVQQSLRSKTGTPVGESGAAILPPLPPPPINVRPQPASVPVQMSLSIVEEGDDFADFLSSPADAAPSAQLSFNDFAMAAPNAPGPSTTQAQTTIASFDAWDDFLSPQPPQPPAKPAPPPSVIKSYPNATKAAPSSHLQPTHVPKPSRKADHSRTLSLLETAAARGRWLAPPSPLPDALPGPPPSGVSAKSSSLEIFNAGSTMQSQQAQAVAQMSSSQSSPAVMSTNVKLPQPAGWAFPPPPVNGPLLQPAQPNSFASPIPPQYSVSPAPTPTTVPAVSTGSKIGGLSAQDLSFFEGL